MKPEVIRDLTRPYAGFSLSFVYDIEITLDPDEGTEIALVPTLVIEADASLNTALLWLAG